jgi:ParB family chromosome partitioning protein
MKQTSEMNTSGIYHHGVQTGNVKISELHDFKGHPFKVTRDMELFELRLNNV